jgi:teichuronic acid biosynthesis glycosyltransferase TuaC
MKIALVSQIFPVREQPYRGHSVFQTALRLRQWADVRAISPHASYPSWLKPKTRLWSSTDLSYSPEGIPTKYCSYPALPVLSRVTNGSLCARAIEPLIAADLPDVILSYWVYPDGFAAARVGRRLGIPVVIKAIGTDINDLRGPVHKALSRKALQDASFCLTVSEDLRRKIIAMGIGAERVQAISNGCDTSVFYVQDRELARKELGLSLDGRLVVYVGRYDIAKGLVELLNAVPKIAAAHPRLTVALVGDGPARPELEGHVTRLGIQDHVKFVAPCRSSGVAKWMAASDLFTLPSYREGCPNVVIEALSCGKPVVAANVGGVPDLVDDECGILVPPRDAEALARAISAALGRTWDCEAISQRRRRSWEQVAAETFEICASVLPVQSGAYAAARSAGVLR